MAIKQLEEFLKKKHLQTLPLSALAETRLGIDASHYLRLLLEDEKTREPLLPATGGLPLALTARLEADLKAFEKLKITPVFVFPGIFTAKRARFEGMQEDECRDRKLAWDKYEAGQTEDATKLFEGKSNITQWDLWRAVLRIFRIRNVEYIVAPYIAWSQLVYLYLDSKTFVHAIYCPVEALLYPQLDRIITSIDLTSDHPKFTPKFTFVIKRSILNELGLTDDQFLDCGILSGFDHFPTFPPTLHDPSFKSKVELVKQHKSGERVIANFAEHPAIKHSNYFESFCRARAMVKYSLVMNSAGTVTALPLAAPPPQSNSHHHTNITTADVPVDLHDVFTYRLPDEIFFYFSRGLVGPQALVWLTSGCVIEPPPLDNGETTEYRRFVKEVITEGATGPRATALCLLSSVMHPWWQKKRVLTMFWFDAGPGHPSKDVPHSHASTVQLVERATAWAVPTNVIEEELRRQNWSMIDFALCLGATSNDRLATRTKMKPNPAHPLDKKDEIVANVIWRFLELRGFLTHTHTHAALARAMYAAISVSRVNDKFQDPLYLFLELVRAGVMHGNLWSNRAYSGGPSFGTDEEKKSMLLVMRVLSILPLQFKSVQWSGPLSRELLAFNSFVRSLARALRTLIECTALNLLLRQPERRSREDLLDVSLSLPFQTDVNTGYGILIKVYLDGLVHLNDGPVVDADAEGVRTAKDEALEFCEDTFKGVKDPQGEVMRGFRFWDAAVITIRSLLADKNCLPELAEQFEIADRWLAPMRP